MNDTKALRTLWLEKAQEPTLHAELEKMTDEECYEAFYTDLAFGTGGIRGVMGAGTNRMNIYVVARAAAGVGRMLLKKKDSPSVAIGYDCRHHSEEFARISAGALAEQGVKVWIYPSLRPTPMVSFAVREKHCDAGIMITASHNPAKYNGFKAYGPDGCQLDLEDSETVMQVMETLDMFDCISGRSFDDWVKDGRIEILGDDVDEAFDSACLKVQQNPGILEKSGLKVIYTPLHGAGNLPVRRVLKKAGLTRVSVVPEQEKPDGGFPTCPFPNPEIAQAMELGIEQMQKENADLLLATDPDSDRVGIALPGPNGPVLISGNQMGALLTQYLFSVREENHTLPEKPVLVKTVVTSPLSDRIVTSYGGEVRDVLTGFKFIGEQIRLLEEAGEADRYVLGFEESYGYLPGIHVRDKDAVSAGLLICKMAAYYHKKGKTLLDVMKEIYTSYGYYLDAQANHYFEGSDGMKTMKGIMDRLLSNPPEEVGGTKVVEIRDYEAGVITKTETGEQRPTGLPSSRVLKLVLYNACSLTIRPSGTEPKIKLYYSAVSDKKKHAEELLDVLKKAGEELLSEAE